MHIKHIARRFGWKRVTAILLAMVMSVGILLPAGPDVYAVTQAEIQNLKNQASSLTDKKDAIQSELSKLEKSKNTALNQKFRLEEKISIIQEQIRISEETIAKYGEMIAIKEVELAEAQAEEARYYDEFCSRVRSMEERGEISYWAVLFNASSFSDLLDRVSAISEVVDYDNMVMDQLEAARQAVADAKKELEENKAAEEATKAELAAQKSELETERAKVNTLINQISSQADVYEEKLHDLEDDSVSLSQQIKQAEATYAAQIAAQKKAEAEARRKAAEAAAQQQNQNNSGGSGNSGTPTVVIGGNYIWPLSGYRRVTSPFGNRICPFHGAEFHGGVDIPAPSGTPIMATKGGVVIISAYGSSYGNYVVVAHSDGGRSLYAHMSFRSVSAGQSVSQGTVLGGVGTTGSSTGNHLHFELWMGNSQSTRVNPVAYCS
ncbi:MAG: peptidoglycan DD-metalloendopeptidase family protein [Ruminiclostridium sp.]|nr:peptidoglycan DD-metalloendopeptidase family protein [Ruminiclostridium sp.]